MRGAGAPRQPAGGAPAVDAFGMFSEFSATWKLPFPGKLAPWALRGVCSLPPTPAQGPPQSLVCMSPAGSAASLLAGAGTRILVQNKLPEPDLGMGDSWADSLGSCLTAVWQLLEASLGWAWPPEGASAGCRALVRPEVHA